MPTMFNRGAGGWTPGPGPGPAGFGAKDTEEPVSYAGADGLNRLLGKWGAQPGDAQRTARQYSETNYRPPAPADAPASASAAGIDLSNPFYKDLQTEINTYDTRQVTKAISDYYRSANKRMPIKERTRLAQDIVKGRVDPATLQPDQIPWDMLQREPGWSPVAPLGMVDPAKGQKWLVDLSKRMLGTPAEKQSLVEPGFFQGVAQGSGHSASFGVQQIAPGRTRAERAGQFVGQVLGALPATVLAAETGGAALGAAGTRVLPWLTTGSRASEAALSALRAFGTGVTYTGAQEAAQGIARPEEFNLGQSALRTLGGGAEFAAYGAVYPFVEPAVEGALSALGRGVRRVPGGQAVMTAAANPVMQRLAQPVTRGVTGAVSGGIAGLGVGAVKSAGQQIASGDPSLSGWWQGTISEGGQEAGEEITEGVTYGLASAVFGVPVRGHGGGVNVNTNTNSETQIQAQPVDQFRAEADRLTQTYGGPHRVAGTNGQPFTVQVIPGDTQGQVQVVVSEDPNARWTTTEADLQKGFLQSLGLERVAGQPATAPAQTANPAAPRAMVPRSAPAQGAVDRAAVVQLLAPQMAPADVQQFLSQSAQVSDEMFVTLAERTLGNGQRLGGVPRLAVQQPGAPIDRAAVIRQLRPDLSEQDAEHLAAQLSFVSDDVFYQYLGQQGQAPQTMTPGAGPVRRAAPVQPYQGLDRAAIIRAARPNMDEAGVQKLAQQTGGMGDEMWLSWAQRDLGYTGPALGTTGPVRSPQQTGQTSQQAPGRVDRAAVLRTSPLRLDAAEITDIVQRTGNLDDATFLSFVAREFGAQVPRVPGAIGQSPGAPEVTTVAEAGRTLAERVQLLLRLQPAFTPSTAQAIVQSTMVMSDQEFVAWATQQFGQAAPDQQQAGQQAGQQDAPQQAGQQSAPRQAGRLSESQLEAVAQAAGFRDAAEARAAVRAARGWPEAGDGVLEYVSPRERPLSPGEEQVRQVAYALKQGHPGAVDQAADVMARQIQPGSVLVPIPSSNGDITPNSRLAEAIARRLGGNTRVAEALYRKAPVRSTMTMRKGGQAGPGPEYHGFQADEVSLEGIDRSRIVFVDNVMTSGATFEAARQAVGGGRGVAYARSKNGDMQRLVSRLPDNVRAQLEGELAPPSGAQAEAGQTDPFADLENESPEQRVGRLLQQHQETTQEYQGLQQRLERRLRPEYEKEAVRRNRLEKEWRDELTRRVKDHGLVAPYKGGRLNEDLYSRVPPFLRSKEGVPLDELARDMGYEGDEALVADLEKLRTKRRYRPDDPEIQRQVQEEYLKSEEGRGFRDQLAYYQVALRVSQQELLDAGWRPATDTGAGELPTEGGYNSNSPAAQLEEARLILKAAQRILETGRMPTGDRMTNDDRSAIHAIIDQQREAITRLQAEMEGRQAPEPAAKPETTPAPKGEQAWLRSRAEIAQWIRGEHSLLAIPTIDSVFISPRLANSPEWQELVQKVTRNGAEAWRHMRTDQGHETLVLGPEGTVPPSPLYSPVVQTSAPPAQQGATQTPAEAAPQVTPQATTPAGRQAPQTQPQGKPAGRTVTLNTPSEIAHWLAGTDPAMLAAESKLADTNRESINELRRGPASVPRLPRDNPFANQDRPGMVPDDVVAIRVPKRLVKLPAWKQLKAMFNHQFPWRGRYYSTWKVQENIDGSESLIRDSALGGYSDFAAPEGDTTAAARMDGGDEAEIRRQIRSVRSELTTGNAESFRQRANEISDLAERLPESETTDILDGLAEEMRLASIWTQQGKDRNEITRIVLTGLDGLEAQLTRVEPTGRPAPAPETQVARGQQPAPPAPRANATVDLRLQRQAGGPVLPELHTDWSKAGALPDNEGRIPLSIDRQLTEQQRAQMLQAMRFGALGGKTADQAAATWAKFFDQAAKRSDPAELEQAQRRFGSFTSRFAYYMSEGASNEMYRARDRAQTVLDRLTNKGLAGARLWHDPDLTAEKDLPRMAAAVRRLKQVWEMGAWPDGREMTPEEHAAIGDYFDQMRERMDLLVDRARYANAGLMANQRNGGPHYLTRMPMDQVWDMQVRLEAYLTGHPKADAGTVQEMKAFLGALNDGRNPTRRDAAERVQFNLTTMRKRELKYPLFGQFVRQLAAIPAPTRPDTKDSHPAHVFDDYAARGEKAPKQDPWSQFSYEHEDWENEGWDGSLSAGQMPPESDPAQLTFDEYSQANREAVRRELLAAKPARETYYRVDGQEVQMRGDVLPGGGMRRVSTGEPITVTTTQKPRRGGTVWSEDGRLVSVSRFNRYDRPAQVTATDLEAALKERHQNAVMAAVQANRPVPDAVLNEYPGIKAEAARNNPPAADLAAVRSREAKPLLGWQEELLRQPEADGARYVRAGDEVYQVKPGARGGFVVMRADSDYSFGSGARRMKLSAEGITPAERAVAIETYRNAGGGDQQAAGRQRQLDLQPDWAEKLPPVPKGFVRLYRAEGTESEKRVYLEKTDPSNRQDVVDRWWTDDPNQAEEYARRFWDHPAYGYGPQPSTGRVFYLDLPRAEAARLKASKQGEEVQAHIQSRGHDYFLPQKLRERAQDVGRKFVPWEERQRREESGIRQYWDDAEHLKREIRDAQGWLARRQMMGPTMSSWVTNDLYREQVGRSVTVSGLQVADWLDSPIPDDIDSITIPADGAARKAWQLLKDKLNPMGGRYVTWRLTKNPDGSETLTRGSAGPKPVLPNLTNYSDPEIRRSVEAGITQMQRRVAELEGKGPGPGGGRRGRRTPPAGQEQAAGRMDEGAARSPMAGVIREQAGQFVGPEKARELLQRLGGPGNEQAAARMGDGGGEPDYFTLRYQWRDDTEGMFGADDAQYLYHFTTPDNFLRLVQSEALRPQGGKSVLPAQGSPHSGYLFYFDPQEGGVGWNALEEVLANRLEFEQPVPLRVRRDDAGDLKPDAAMLEGGAVMSGQAVPTDRIEWFDPDAKAWRPVAETKLDAAAEQHRQRWIPRLEQLAAALRRQIDRDLSFWGPDAVRYSGDELLRLRSRIRQLQEGYAVSERMEAAGLRRQEDLTLAGQLDLSRTLLRTGFNSLEGRKLTDQERRLEEMRLAELEAAAKFDQTGDLAAARMDPEEPAMPAARFKQAAIDLAGLDRQLSRVDLSPEQRSQILAQYDQQLASIRQVERQFGMDQLRRAQDSVRKLTQTGRPEFLNAPANRAELEAAQQTLAQAEPVLRQLGYENVRDFIDTYRPSWPVRSPRLPDVGGAFDQQAAAQMPPERGEEQATAAMAAVRGPATGTRQSIYTPDLVAEADRATAWTDAPPRGAKGWFQYARENWPKWAQAAKIWAQDDLLDSDWALRRVAQELAGRREGMELPPDMNPYMQRKLLAKRVPARVEHYVKRWQKAMEPVSSNIEDYLRYADARSVVWRSQEHGTENWPINYDRAREIIQQAEASPLGQGFRQAFDNEQNLFKEALNDLVDAGLLGDESYARIMAAYEDNEGRLNYIPMYRKASEQVIERQQTGRRIVDLNDPVRRASSGEEQLQDPIERRIKYFSRMAGAAEMNRNGRALKRLIDTLDPEGRFMKRVELPAMRDFNGDPRTLAIEEMEKLADGSEIDPQATAVFFRPPKWARVKSDTVVAIWEGGQPVYYDAQDKSLFQAITNMDPITSSVIGKATDTLAEVARSGMTASPSFAIANLFKDGIESFVFSKSQKYPGQALAEAIRVATRDVPFMERVIENGVRKSGWLRPERQSVAMLRELANPGEKIKLRQLWDWYSQKREDVEFGTRLGEASLEYKRRLKQAGIEDVAALRQRLEDGTATAEELKLEHDAFEWALYEANRITLDFTRKGRWVRQVNRKVPMFSIPFEVGVRHYEALVENPKGYFLKGILPATILAALTVAFNADDEDYLQASDQERDAYTLISMKPFGGKGFLRVPKAQGLTGIWMNAVERTFREMLLNDPEPMRDFGKSIIRDVGPRTSTPLLDFAIMAATGYGGLDAEFPLVPRDEQRLPAWQQYDERTPGSVRAVGKALNVSPRKLQWTVDRFFPNYADFFWRVERGARQVAGQDVPAARPQDTIALGRFYSQPGTGKQGRDVDRFYQRRDDADRVYFGLREQIGQKFGTEVNMARLTGPQQAYLAQLMRRLPADQRALYQQRKALLDTADTLANLRKERDKIQASNMSPEAKQRAVERINQRITQAASGAVGR